MHKRPDADSAGSAAAFGDFLKTKRIPFVYYCSTEISKELGFLGVEPALSKEEIKFLNPDLAIVFDSGDTQHAGIDFLSSFIVNFDHHSTNTNFGNLNLVEADASSTTEVLYHFFNLIRFPITKKIASYLLSGILVDTDHFFNPATTASSLAMASELITYGVSMSQVRQLLFERRGINSLQLIGEILSRLQKNERYGIAVTHVSEKDLEKYHMTFEDLEGISNILNSIGEAKAMLLIKSQGDSIRVSMRTTKDNVDVGRLAEMFGGGGHRKAAGFAIKGKLETSEGKVRVV